MHVTFTHRTKRIAVIMLIVQACGLLLQYWARTTPPLPSGDANIGAGLIWLLGLSLSIISGLAIVSLVVYALLRATGRRHSTAAWLAVLVAVIVALVGWYVTVGAKSIQHASYQSEVANRRSLFVTYNGVPRFDTVHAQTTAITATPSTSNASAMTIDLHDCSPGAATVGYANGAVHFVFSGIQVTDKLPSPANNECIFYMGAETKGQPWNRELPAKCTRPITNNPADNRLSFQVDASGIRFDMFLGSCQDLHTGRAPEL